MPVTGFKPSAYLDTSVINFLFADDAPEKKEITVDFFENFIRTGLYNAAISEAVIAEINNTKDQNKRQRLLDVINEYKPELVSLNDTEGVDDLAAFYVQQKVFPPNKYFDALHVAVSVLNRIDYLVSWNYKHLSNVNCERKILAANYLRNIIHPIRILTPAELIFYGS